MVKALCLVGQELSAAPLAQRVTEAKMVSCQTMPRQIQARLRMNFPLVYSCARASSNSNENDKAIPGIYSRRRSCPGRLHGGTRITGSAETGSCGHCISAAPRRTQILLRTHTSQQRGCEAGYGHRHLQARSYRGAKTRRRTVQALPRRGTPWTCLRGGYGGPCGNGGRHFRAAVFQDRRG